MKLRECKIHGQPCYPQVSRESPGGRESSRGVAEAPRPEFVANLTVKLLVERLSGHPIKPNHFKCYDRTPAPPLWARFLIRHSHLLIGNHSSISRTFSSNNAIKHTRS